MVVALDPFSLLPLWCFFTTTGHVPPIMATCPPARTTFFHKCDMISGFSTVPTISSVSGDVYIGDDYGNIFALHAKERLSGQNAPRQRATGSLKPWRHLSLMRKSTCTLAFPNTILITLTLIWSGWGYWQR